jgi:hypothetical protein
MSPVRLPPPPESIKRKTALFLWNTIGFADAPSSPPTAPESIKRKTTLFLWKSVFQRDPRPKPDKYGLRIFSGTQLGSAGA